MLFATQKIRRLACSGVMLASLAWLSGCGGGGDPGPNGGLVASTGWLNIGAPGTTMQGDNNYSATGTSQVTLTLPTTATTGAVIRVRGVGSGGWLIAQQAGQSVISPNSWTTRATIQAWRDVASSSDGTKLVAVVNMGQIYTSTDAGATWTARDTIRTWHRVASSASGSKLVAVTFGGQIYTSTDSGLSWTPRESTRYWSGIASSTA